MAQLTVGPQIKGLNDHLNQGAGGPIMAYTPCLFSQIFVAGC